MLTTGQVAAHCQVTHKSVNNWIRDGKLHAYMTPGRHHRIRVRDLREFLAKSGLPPLDDDGQPAPSGSGRVLVVDDEPLVVGTVSQMLRRWGYEVGMAMNGFSAGLEIERFRPDLVVLDLMMPYMDGFGVCETVKTDPATRHIKVLVVTGFTEQGFIDRALASGADGWMAKPLRAAELRSRVVELVGRPGSRNG